MIFIDNVRDIRRKYDEIWLIVRSLQGKPEIPGVKILHVPELSPSQELFYQYCEWKRKGNWNYNTFQKKYVPHFLKEIRQEPAISRINELLKTGQQKDISLCCYCWVEDMCHRSIILGVLQGMAKKKGIKISYEKDFSEYYEKFMEKDWIWL